MICNYASQVLEVISSNKRCINLSTIADINYDATQLTQLTTNELLYQLICRKDLEHPKRPHQLDAIQLYRNVVNKVKAAADEFRNQKLDFLADGLDQMLVEFETDGEPHDI